jgi:hypothetical protein
MYKRDITYEDLDGNEVTDTFYFNLTKTELMTMGADYKDGYEQILKRIIETKDRAALIEQFKKIINAAYGVRGEDGKRFIKNAEVLEAFQQTGAYDVLFMEFATDDKAAAEFINGAFPKDISAQIQAEMSKATLPAIPPVGNADLFTPPPVPKV